VEDYQTIAIATRCGCDVGQTSGRRGLPLDRRPSGTARPGKYELKSATAGRGEGEGSCAFEGDLSSSVFLSRR